VQSLCIFLRRVGVWAFWPALAIVIAGELIPHAPQFGLPDKLLHFVAYFGLAALATDALGARRAAVFAVLGLVILGGALEILQAFVGRDAEWLDEVANTAGAISGGALAALALRALGRSD